MTCDRCGNPLAWEDRHECAEVGEVHHVECIAICLPCQLAFTEDANTDAARGL